MNAITPKNLTGTPTKLPEDFDQRLQAAVNGFQFAPADLPVSRMEHVRPGREGFGLTQFDRTVAPIRAGVVTRGDSLLFNLKLNLQRILKRLTMTKMNTIMQDMSFTMPNLTLAPLPAAERVPVKPRKRLPRWSKVALWLVGLFVVVNAGVAYAEPLSGPERFVKCGVASGLFKDPRCNGSAPQPARVTAAPEQPKAAPAVVSRSSLEEERASARRVVEDSLNSRNSGYDSGSVPTMTLTTEAAASAPSTRVAQVQPAAPAPVEAAPAPAPVKSAARLTQTTAPVEVQEQEAPAASVDDEFTNRRKPDPRYILKRKPLPPRAEESAPSPRYQRREAPQPRYARNHERASERPAHRPVAAPGVRIGTKVVSGGAGRPNCYLPSLRRDTSRTLKVEAGGGVQCHDLRYDTQIETHQRSVQEVLLSQSRSGRSNATVIRSRKYKD